MFVIKNPDITKKISTPKNPPAKYLELIWKIHTATTAIALKP
jgi:hypothetical protein